MTAMRIDWDADTITDPDIEISHAQAVAEIRTEKRHRGEMYRAALYTYRACYITETVGQGPGKTSYQDYAAQLGYAKSYVTLLRRLGRALVVHRVEPKSPLYSDLTRAASKKEIGRLLDEDDPVPHDQLREALSAHGVGRGGRQGFTVDEDPRKALHQAAEVVRAALSTADTDLLVDLEDTVGDLFFELRSARRAAWGTATGTG